MAAPRDYHEYLTGQAIAADAFDLQAHLFVEGVMHKASAGTGATCIAVAARIEGTVVHEVCRKRGRREPIRIGHPSGVLGIVADVERDGSDWKVHEVLFSRTARRIMEGTAYVRRSRL